mmetsp:Transcript_29281/g.79255  ORF Transcript_29281/g.79255 Transcript_29281/m.79255 type:complete len:496 (-) Transcript_29281:1113-2600(-)
MYPFSVFLLLLQVRCGEVSSFTAQHQQQSVGILGMRERRFNLLSQDVGSTIATGQLLQGRKNYVLLYAESAPNESGDKEAAPRRTATYDLGVGKNLPFGSTANDENNKVDPKNPQWNVPEDPNSQSMENRLTKSIAEQFKYTMVGENASEPRQVRRMVARTDASNKLRNALWHEEHYSKDTAHRVPAPMHSESSTTNATDSGEYNNDNNNNNNNENDNDNMWHPTNGGQGEGQIRKPELFYPNIDLSIPPSVYDPETSKDIVWDLMRWEAYKEAQREPLLVSFLYSSILNHDSLESSLAFLLANKLSSAAMISTQVQSLILDAFDKDPSIGRAIRADIMAVRDRDPACTCLPDVFLYFKGFHALQTYRVAHAIWKNDNKQVLAHYLQSQMSQTFQIDIHPNATLGSGIMLDHGTGIVIGETAHLGHNCSILHHVTLGGSGKKGVDRHPKVRNIKNCCRIKFITIRTLELIGCACYDKTMLHRSGTEFCSVREQVF